MEINPIAALAMMNEPLRRRIYDHAVAVEQGVSREGAAAALGVTRSVAAFHLDKLVGVGLLEVDYRRPAGRGGPGAGRPAKWYHRALGEVSASLPERRYDLAAALLASAVERAAHGDVEVGQVLSEIAREYGRGIAAAFRPGDLGSSPLGEVGERLVQVLAEHGYEPRLRGSLITLVNCPFHALAKEHCEIICLMNHALLCGVAEATGLPSSAARLDPGSGRCCVTLVA